MASRSQLLRGVLPSNVLPSNILPSSSILPSSILPSSILPSNILSSNVSSSKVSSSDVPVATRRSLPVRATANGNTFLIFDCMQNKFNYLRMLFWFVMKKVDSCLVLYHNSSHNDQLNVRMDVYFPKGGFCGNGARAVSHYLHTHYNFGSYAIVLSNEMINETIHLNKLNSGQYCAELIVPDLILPLMIYGYEFYFTKTLSEPHLITFETIPIDQFIWIAERAQVLMDQHAISRGVNVNLCQINEDKIYVKTWERGIQRFTKSCGTGVVSCVETARITGRIKSKCEYMVHCADEILIVCIREDRKKCLLYGETTLDL